MEAPPRILKVQYRSMLGRKRVATFYCKVPRGGSMYELNEALTRLIITNQASWYRVDRAKPGEITPDIRAGLERWLPAMQHTTSITGVDIQA